MAGDPYEDSTNFVIRRSTTYSYYDTTSSPTQTTSTGTTTYASPYDVDLYIERAEEINKKLQELLRKTIIQEMKDSWTELKKEFHPVPKLRPAVQLRGVCFGGRGWA